MRVLTAACRARAPQPPDGRAGRSHPADPGRGRRDGGTRVRPLPQWAGSGHADALPRSQAAETGSGKTGVRAQADALGHGLRPLCWVARRRSCCPSSRSSTRRAVMQHLGAGMPRREPDRRARRARRPSQRLLRLPRPPRWRLARMTAMWCLQSAPMGYPANRVPTSRGLGRGRRWASGAAGTIISRRP